MLLVGLFNWTESGFDCLFVFLKKHLLHLPYSVTVERSRPKGTVLDSSLAMGVLLSGFERMSHLVQKDT